MPPRDKLKKLTKYNKKDMRKRFKFLFCLMLALMASITSVKADYWQLRVKAVLASGEPATSYVSAGGCCSAPEPTSSDYTMPAPVNNWYSDNPDTYLKATPRNGEEFMGWYEDEACTRQFYTSQTGNAYGAKMSFVSHAAAAADVQITTVYALFSVPAVNFSTLGEAPTTGNYYLYGVGYNGLAGLYEYSDGKVVRGYKDPNQAVLYTLTFSSATNFTISCVDEGVTKYVNKDGTYIKPETFPEKILEDKGDGTYMVNLNNGHSSGYTWWEMESSGRADYEQKNTTTTYQRWMFIPEATYNNLVSVESLRETGSITINSAPTASGTTNVKFNVSDIGPIAAFDCAITAGDDGNFVLGTPTRSDNVITVPVTYTAHNVHSGISTPIAMATVTLTAKNEAASSASGQVPVYVDLQPKFGLNVMELDWSYDGETLVETYYAGMEVAASKRARLQDKLIKNDAQTTGVAADFATWTATITGTNADQFKFANGTRTVSEPYTPELLDVIFAPTATGDFTATLHIVTSYTDANSNELTDTHDITLRGKALDVSYIHFAANGNETASDNETHNFGDIIGTNTQVVTAELGKHGVSNLTKVWNDPDGVFEFDVNSVDLTKSNQTLTFRAHRQSPVTTATNHTATLTVSGDGTEGPVSGVLTLTYQALPLLTPTVTWNWSTIGEYKTASDPVTTNSDGAWTLTKTAGDKVTYNAEEKTATVPYLHHEPGLSATFALSIPQTDTYAAFNNTYTSTINAAAPADIYINSAENFSTYVEGNSWVTYDASKNSVHISIDNAYFKWSGQSTFEFDYIGATRTNTFKEVYSDNSTRTIYSESMAAGHYELAVSPDIVKLHLYGSNDFANVHYYEKDAIEVDYDRVILINDNGVINSLDLTCTFAKQAVNVTLSPAAQTYFELQSTGKSSGSSLYFGAEDGLAPAQAINKVITVAMKEGADAAAAAAASESGDCWITFGDTYTYNHFEFNMPLLLRDAYDVTFKHHAHGSYTVTYEDDGVAHSVASADYVKHMTSIAPEHCTVTISAPTPAAGYKFQGWKINDQIVSCKASITKMFDEATTVEPVFGEVEGAFKIDAAYFDDLTEALTVAGCIVEQNPVVTLMKDTLLSVPATYTVPAGVTLLIPYKDNYYELETSPEMVIATAETLYAYRTMTLREGVNFICNGNICVGGKIMAAGGGNKSAYVTGGCGVINMVHGGHIEVNDGGNLYCWGFIKGQDMDQGNNTVGTGTVTANNGAKIWENFYLGDWRGGTATSNIYFEREEKMLFPFQSYSIQNIEIPTTYKYGSKLMSTMAVHTGYGDPMFTVATIGSDQALFLLQDEESIVRKWYDPTTDLSCFELNGTALLGSLILNLPFVGDFDSGDCNLPISNSMHVMIANCNMTLAKPLTVQAGAVLEIKNTATVNLVAPIHLFDVDEWGLYIHNYYFRSFNILTSHKDRGAENSKAGLDDAKFIIDGTLNVKNGMGYIYSTTGGADLMGNGGGVITFEGALPDAGTLWQVNVLSGSPYITWVENPENAANLHNEDDSYTRSIGYATFYNINGRWYHEEDKDEQEDHTYWFTYMDNGNDGEDVGTNAVYSHDKTGLEAREKWFNVDADENCADWWIGQADGNHYNYTYLNAWHQFMATETPSVFSGSNNKLYAQDECSWSEMGEVDENCLYTFIENEQEVKKALVNGHFIPLESNGYDPAYHAVANAEQYYICFAGCNWHEATPYIGELKAYTIVEDAKELIYIWFNNDWLHVEREEPFFYTADEVTNVKTYYDYVDGEWQIATPFVRVEDAMETREFYMLKEALNVAQLKKNVTITILRDVHADMTAYTFADLNTNCTLDLNGHVMDMTISGSGTTEVKMFAINMGTGTFTITDNSEYQLGEFRLHANPNTETQSKRWHGIYLTAGELEINAGKVYVEDLFTYTSTSNAGMASGVTIAAGQKFTLDGNGEVEAKATYATYGVHLAASTTTTGKTYIKDGTITATTTSTTSAIGLYIGSGTAYVSGGTINALTQTNTSRGIYVEGSASNYIGHLEMTGGTVNATATTTTAIGIYVGGTYSFNATKPNTIKATFRGEANISGGTINSESLGTTTAYGVQSLGTTTITGGTFNVKTKTTTCEGLLVQDGTTTISDSAVFNVNATTTTAYGIYANGATPADKTGRPYNPVVTVNGGTFNVSTLGTTTCYGIIVNGATRAITSTASGYYAGNYASAGTVIVNDGVFNVTAKTKTVYGANVGALKTVADATSYDPATANPKCTINGGYFKLAGTSGVNVLATTATTDNQKVNGGYFSHSGNLATYANPQSKVVVTLPKTDPNYPTYKYEVATGYTITFMDGETVLQSNNQKAGTAAVYSATEPTKANTETNSYIFDGWATEADGEVVYAKGTALPEVTADATYYAHFEETTLKCKVTFNANGGTCATEFVYVTPGEKLNTAISALPYATRTGYTQKGNTSTAACWYTTKTGSTKVKLTNVISADVTYYAQWTAIKHNLTWELGEGVVTTAGQVGSSTVFPDVDATGTQTYNLSYAAAIKAPVVERTGYTFINWGVPTVAATMPLEDLTYTAQWSPNTNTAYVVKHFKQNLDGTYPEEPTEIDELTGTSDTYVTPNTKSYAGYITPAKQTVQILADGSQVLNYEYSCIGYTITFDANGGTCGTTSADVKHGATLTLPVATREGVGNLTYEFDGWFTKAVGGDQITASTIIQRNIGTLYAHWTEIEEPMPDIVAENGETITIDDDYIATQGTNEVTNLIIENGGSVTVTANIEVDNLYLEGADATSGQLLAAPNKVTATNAYYDHTFNETVRHWRAFGVPWMVNLDATPIKEVKNQAGDPVSRTLVLGRDYDIIYYNGAKRAAQGAGTHCWEFVNEGSHILQPGKCYMIAFNSNVGTLRFTKSYGAPVVFNGTMNVAANTADDAANSGINAIANPMTYHTTMDAGPTTAQVHNGGLIGEDEYILYNIEDKKFVVGKAVYVQVDAAQPVVINVAGEAGDMTIAAAPKRNAQRVTEKRYLSLNDYYAVAIQGTNETRAGHLYVLPEEDKTDEYVIGHDLAKMGMSASASQIWVKRYGVNLCMHTAEPIDGVTEIPVNIYAPAAGEYTITNDQSPMTNDNYAVYLTLNGEAIWNLSNSPYTLTLNKGIVNSYGLRISARAPQVTTGIDEAVVDAKGETQKVLINNKVYIIRGNEVYTVDGRVVK